MKLSSFPEAVKHYEELTGEDFEWNRDEGCWVLDSNEFMTYRIGDYKGIKYFEIRQTYGFTKNFVQKIKEYMQQHNLKWIVTTTQRNPKAHIKKWKMKHLSKFDYDFEDRHYYVLLGFIDNLK